MALRPERPTGRPAAWLRQVWLRGLPLRLPLWLPLWLAACGNARPVVEGNRACISWSDEIGPLLSAQCASCHSGPAPQGGFDATSYISVIGGWDRPTWATAGDASSRLLAPLWSSPGQIHPAVAPEVYRQVRTWIVDCRLNYRRSQVHEGGVMNPADGEAFHGAVLRSTGWQFDKCGVCHGQDLQGGSAGVACQSCHPGGPTTCQTCHGRRMGGAHVGHVTGRTQGTALGCGECHTAPRDYRDPGHLYNADGTARTTPVEVVFGPLASLTPVSGTRQGPPVWHGDTRTCDAVYCHGAVFPDTAARLTRPLWSADPTQAECGTCHGLPPSGHDRLPTAVQRRCGLCHNRTASDDKTLRKGGLHGNGKADLGDGSGMCWACHGEKDNPAPPGDLQRGGAVSAVGVGAHQSHLKGSHRLRGPIPCGDCHVVPQKLDSPGHIDDDLPAEVFPQVAGFTSLAQADEAQPRWDHGTARCADVYCHGGGKRMRKDGAASLLRTPLWTQPGQAACGTCHGIPPLDADHDPKQRLTECATCHPATMDPTGALRVTGPPGAETSTHINGVVDVR